MCSKEHILPIFGLGFCFWINGFCYLCQLDDFFLSSLTSLVLSDLARKLFNLFYINLEMIQ